MKIFENPEFGRVRTTVIDGEPWFVAADVCHALDIGNPSDALNRLDDDERTLVSIEGAVPDFALFLSQKTHVEESY